LLQETASLGKRLSYAEESVRAAEELSALTGERQSLGLASAIEVVAAEDVLTSRAASRNSILFDLLRALLESARLSGALVESFASALSAAEKASR
jgi:hypothetical protein